MDVVVEIVGTVASLHDQIKKTDPLLLTSEQRISPHLLGQTVGGRQVRISLPRSAELFDGDVLAWDGDVAIVVEAAPEELLIIAPEHKLDWGMVGFQLGNLHRPVRFTETAILTPAEPAVADMLKRIGVPFQQQKLPFLGKRFGAGHSHSH
jgi:urease accessory protein UreE